MTVRDQRKRRHRRIRKKISGTRERPRLFVFRSNKHIYAQVIDDGEGEVLVQANDMEIDEDKSKKELAGKVGELVAEKAEKEGIETVVFDRGGYPYQGRVKAVAEGARKGGLEF